MRTVLQRYGAPVLLFLAALFASYFGVSEPAGEDTPPSAAPSTDHGTFYPVQYVIDGDTFVVLKDGHEETIRLIGIDTPEKAGPYTTQECFGTEATAEASRILEGKRVRLESDATQDTRDIYGRLLMYAFLEDGTFFNEHMLRAGYAHEYTFRGVAYQYQKEFREAEETAHAHALGLWASNACTKSPT